MATVYDLSPLIYDDEGALAPWFDDIAARASAILTPSAFTAGELERRCGVPRERITVIGGAPALEAAGAQPLEEHELHGLGIRQPFVLRYGGYTKRKNVGLLLEAWRGVGEGTLVLAGPPQPVRDQLVGDARARRVVLLDYLPAPTLARLVRSAAAVASPSLYEGFGLPMLEALAAGTPVVAVRTPFAEEVCGDAALLVDPDPTSLGSALRRVLTDAELASRLMAAGPVRSATFTWAAAARRVLAAYDAVLGGA